MIPKYSLNLLRSASNWLSTRSQTMWARDFGHSDLMADYAKDLAQLALHLQGDTPVCKTCGGLVGAPLGRELNDLDCKCCGAPVVPSLTPVQIRDLQTTIRRLAAKVAKHDPTSALPDQALDLLDRQGFKHNPLRGE